MDLNSFPHFPQIIHKSYIVRKTRDVVGKSDMVRRSRLEIYFDILEVINKGITKPTQIMYKTNLSWIVLQEMFETLMKGGFIREENEKSSQRYFVTEKGKNALSYHMKSLEGLVKTEPIFSR